MLERQIEKLLTGSNGNKLPRKVSVFKSKVTQHEKLLYFALNFVDYDCDSPQPHELGSASPGPSIQAHHHVHCIFLVCQFSMACSLKVHVGICASL